MNRTKADTMKTILYFYVGFHGKSGLPSFNSFEYRFLETFCKKYRVVVAVFTRGGKHLTDRIAPANAEIVYIRDLPLIHRIPEVIRWPIQTVVHILQVAILIRSIRPDLVNGNWITRLSGFYCAVANFHPLLATAWGSDILIEAKESRILRAFARFTLRVADAVIIDSEVQRRAVLELGCKSSKVYCFPWGIDLDKFRPNRSLRNPFEPGRNQTKVVVSTRMHSAVYGVEYLIRAIPPIISKVKEARFLIVGDGPLFEYHKKLARELGVNDQVKFLGRVRNDLIPTVLNSGDLYVSTSFSDGTSASLLEAMACGLPVVATRIPANEEWIEPGENGFLVSPGNSSELAEFISAILQDDRLRMAMRAQNLKLAKERADWKKNSLVLEQCICDLLNTDKHV